MIKRIKIQGYKSLTDVEVSLKPLSVLFGPNAAGKSNFLDALQLLSNMATSRTLKDAFAPPYRGTPLESITFGPEGIQGLLKKEVASFTIEADVELSPAVVTAVDQQIREMKRTRAVEGAHPSNGESGDLSFVREKHLRYRIEVEILPRLGILRVAEEYLSALNANGQPTGKRRPFLECMGNRLHLRMEGQAHPTYYERYLDHTILSLPLYPPHHPHLVAMRQELASWFVFYFEPRERMRAPNPVKEVRHMGLMGEELASFLNTLRALDEPQFRAVEKSLHMIVPSITGIDVGVNNLGEVELRLLEGTTPIPARVVSEGTLRVLGLLALGGAKEPPAVLGFEEPENGIHPRRIRLIAELLKTQAASGTSQLIVTTHSPLLLDLLPEQYCSFVEKSRGKQRSGPSVLGGRSRGSRTSTRRSTPRTRGSASPNASCGAILMPKLGLFVEDFAHEEFLTAMTRRFARDYQVELEIKPYSARGGRGRVHKELRQYLRDLERGHEEWPDLVIVATDANCQGFLERKLAIERESSGFLIELICAIPEPHIEPWLLLDSAAFKTVLGRGCRAPDQKCERDRYKRLLLNAIREAGRSPLLGGLEYAADLVNAMDLYRMEQDDPSLGRLLNDLRRVFTTWRAAEPA